MPIIETITVSIPPCSYSSHMKSYERQVHNRQVDTILKWNQATCYCSLEIFS